MPRRVSPLLQRTDRLCVRLHPNERLGLRARAVQTGMSESDFARHCLLGMTLPPTPQMPSTPYVVLQGLENASAWMQHACHALGSYQVWLDDDPRTRLAKATLQHGVARCLESLAGAAAALQAATAQARLAPYHQ